VNSRWSRLGILFGARSSRSTPDLERLLLDTARLSSGSARLFYLTVSWLSRYGDHVARHRLKRLTEQELATDDQPALGALLALAREHGASRSLRIAAEACAPAASPRPLFDVQRGDPALERIAKRHACPAALPWNLWIPDEPPRPEALRPPHWVIEQNPTLFERVVRKGDLRCSILVTLSLDAPDGEVPSESALARLCSANRIAVRHALADLEREGFRLRRRAPGARSTRIALRT
jgi:hypothetical protein